MLEGISGSALGMRGEAGCPRRVLARRLSWRAPPVGSVQRELAFLPPLGELRPRCKGVGYPLRSVSAPLEAPGPFLRTFLCEILMEAGWPHKNSSDIVLAYSGKFQARTFLVFLPDQFELDFDSLLQTRLAFHSSRILVYIDHIDLGCTVSNIVGIGRHRMRSMGVVIPPSGEYIHNFYTYTG